MGEKLEHLGIIMDGNRRFAKRLLKKPWNGHSWGARKVEKVLDWCYEQKIHIVTLYALSLENINTRSKKELDFLLDLFKKELTSENFHNKIHKNKTCVRFFGKLELLPDELQKVLQNIVETTKNYNSTYLNFAIAYSGRQELIDAIKKLDKKEIDSLDIKQFEKKLYTQCIKDPDLIIRTSGEKRSSGFLLWQSAYSEYCFIDKLWPELDKKDFMAAIDDYKKRQRRFGC